MLATLVILGFVGLSVLIVYHTRSLKKIIISNSSLGLGEPKGPAYGIHSRPENRDECKITIHDYNTNEVIENEAKIVASSEELQFPGKETLGFTNEESNCMGRYYSSTEGGDPHREVWIETLVEKTGKSV